MKTYNYTLNDKTLDSLIDFPFFEKEKNILIQIFCGEKKDLLEKILKEVTNRLPQAICIGSSTDGEINNAEISILKTIISISTFKNTTLKTTYIKETDSFKNGALLASELCCENTKLLLTFTDGDTTNGEEFLNGIASIDGNVLVSGGMAGDNAHFTETFISSQNNILTRGSVGVSFNSDILKVYNAYNFNWSPIGIEHEIEEVEGNRVYKIAGLTPLAFYEKYLGSHVARTLPATGIEFPLIVQKNNIPLARAVIAKHEDGSLSFAGNLHKGDIVKLGFGNVELIMNNPLKSLFNKTKIKNTESFFIYACMARRRYMPNLIDIEINPFSQIATTSGFFTYGEFYHHHNHNELLNQTLTVLSLSEKEIEIQDDESQKDVEDTALSDHARSLQALTHLIQQSSEDYSKQSKELESKNIYAQNLITSQKQFLKYAIHETNTPLSVIMGNIDMHEIKYGKNPYLSNIEVAMKNIFSIYDDLSYLVKRDQVKQTSHQIDLVEYVKGRIDFFTQTALKFKVEFNFISNCEDIFIDFNEIKLQRIVDNNLTNAIKYTLANERIYVILKKINEECNFLIESRSVQILDPQKIFEEYYREEVSQDGFGLGLNLVKRICSEENVGIKLESGENWASFTYTFKGLL
jgi:c-di-GMP phosphodiesterase